MDALEAHKVCDLADAGVGVHQKLLGLAQADTVDVADGRGAVHLLEDADERCFVDARQGGKILQADDAGIVEIDILHQCGHVHTLERGDAGRLLLGRCGGLAQPFPHDTYQHLQQIAADDGVIIGALLGALCDDLIKKAHEPSEILQMEHIAHAHQILEQRGIRHGEFYIQHFQRRSVFFTAVDGVQLLGAQQKHLLLFDLIRLVVHIHGAAAAQNAYHLEIVVAVQLVFPVLVVLAAPEDAAFVHPCSPSFHCFSTISVYSNAMRKGNTCEKIVQYS